MNPYLVSFRWSGCIGRVVVCLVVLAEMAGTSHAAKSKKNAPEKPATAPIYVTAKNDTLTQSGFKHYYDLEYNQAIRDFEAAVNAHPDDPFAVNHLLAAVFFKELYNADALESNAYANNSFLNNHAQIHLDAKTDSRIKELTAKALELCERRLAQDPRDADAYYARGVAHGMASTYTALVNKGWFNALGEAKAARHDHEKALELDPDLSDARLVVGLHSYIVGSLPWPIRTLAHVVGESGNRAQGISDLYTAANGGGDASVDAKVVLALFLRREQRYTEALALESSLSSEHPRNFLFALEEANILMASGNGKASIEAYRRVLANAAKGDYADPHLEFAYFGLGEALRGQRDLAGAAEAYSSVEGLPHSNQEIFLRAQLAAGEMYDLMQERDRAIKMYQTVIAANADSDEAEAARRALKEPYHD